MLARRCSKPVFVNLIRWQRKHLRYRFFAAGCISGEERASVGNYPTKKGPLITVGASLRGAPSFHATRGAHGGPPLHTLFIWMGVLDEVFQVV